MTCAGAEDPLWLEFSRGETHHQKTGLARRVVTRIGTFESYRRCSGGKEEFFEVLFVEGDGVGGFVASVGFGT
jgi:hypothetical protein